MISLSAQQLRQVADLKEQIEDLEQQLNAILGAEGPASFSSEAGVVPQTSQAPKNGRRTFSAESRAKMAAAQKARWASTRGETPPFSTPQEAAEPPRKKRKMTEAWRQALARAHAARRAKAKAAKAGAWSSSRAEDAFAAPKKQVSGARLEALAKARAAKAAKAAKLKSEKGSTKAKAAKRVHANPNNARSEAAKATWAKRKAAKAKQLDEATPF